MGWREESIKVSPENLGATIREMLADVQKEVERAVEKAIKAYVDEDLIPELQRRSPRRATGTEHYADGWTSRKEGLYRIVHNSMKPWLTHLLEFGHIDHDTGVLVAKYPHIRAAYEATINKLEARVLAALS